MTDDDFTDIGSGRCQEAAGENYVMKLAVNSPDHVSFVRLGLGGV